MDVTKFSLFDLNKDHHIEYHELKVAFKALGFDLPKTEILAFLSDYGIPASSLSQSQTYHSNERPHFAGLHRLLLSQDAFQYIAASKIHARGPEEEVDRAFELYNAEGKGKIDIEDLRRITRELGEGIPDVELQAMIDEFDIRGDGGIDRATFVSICMG